MEKARLVFDEQFCDSVSTTSLASSGARLGEPRGGVFRRGHESLS